MADEIRRDAAQNWEEAYSDSLSSVGSVRGKASQCVFFHPGRRFHGDDFTVLGWEKDLDWSRGEFNKKIQVKFKGRVGPEQKKTCCKPPGTQAS